jgi:hypothetical protein
VIYITDLDPRRVDEVRVVREWHRRIVLPEVLTTR